MQLFIQYMEPSCDDLLWGQQTQSPLGEKRQQTKLLSRPLFALVKKLITVCSLASI